MNELSLIGHTIKGLVAGAPAGAAIFTVGNTVNSIVLLPKAAYRTYRALWKSKRIGPNLKAILSILTPVGLVLVPPTVALTSAIGGMGYGFYKTIHSLSKGTKDCWNGVKKLKELANEMLNHLGEDDFSTPDDVYDIKILESLRGLICAFVFAPVEAAGTTIVLFLKWCPVVWQANKLLWRDNNSSISKLIFNASISTLVTLSALLAIPLTPLCTALFSLGDMCYHGYKDGFGSAAKKSFERIANFNTMLNDFIATESK
jgi:hypothetical protein